MESYSVKRFAKMQILTSMHPASLRTFLSPYSDYLAAHGFDISCIGDRFAGDDARQLLAVLINPDAGTPQRLVEALYHVNEIATTDGMDLLVSEFSRAGYALDCPHATAADLAVLAWNTDSSLLEQTCARLYHKNLRVCRLYLGKETTGSVHPLTGGQIASIESAMDDWFESHMLGRHCRIFPYASDPEHCYIVRRGQPYARVSAIDEGRSSSLLFQPEAFDVVIYDTAMRQLRVSSASNSVREEYLRLFGEHMFGDTDHFSRSGILSLLPLVKKGAAALYCADIPGLVDVKLRKAQVDLGGADKRVRIWEGADLFSDPEFAERLTSEPQFTKISLGLKFEGSSRARCFELEPPNVIRFRRDGDVRPAGRFLVSRGFIKGMGH